MLVFVFLRSIFVFGYEKLSRGIRSGFAVNCLRLTAGIGIYSADSSFMAPLCISV